MYHSVYLFPCCNIRLWGETGKRSDGNGQCKDTMVVAVQESDAIPGSKEEETTKQRERSTIFDCSQQNCRLKAPKTAEQPLGSVRGRGHPHLCKLCDLRTVR